MISKGIKKTKINDIYSLLNSSYPFDLQDEWDRSGKINYLYFGNEYLKNPIVGLDINWDIINFALENNSNLIITHHPIYIDEVDLKNKEIQKMVKVLLDNKISLISMHTNFDKHKKGMNYQLLKEIGCSRISQSKKSEYIYFGLMKKYDDFSLLLDEIKNKLEVEYIKYASDLNLKRKRFLKIGIVGGSGSNEIANILKKDKCDIFITSEIKWHLWNYYNLISKSVCLLEVPHSVEKIFIKIITKKLKEFNPKPFFNLNLTIR